MFSVIQHFYYFFLTVFKWICKDPTKYFYSRFSTEITWNNLSQELFFPQTWCCLHFRRSLNTVKISQIVWWHRSARVSQYQVRKCRTCILGSSDFASPTQECELPGMGWRKSGSSANGTPAYFIAHLGYCNFPHCIYNKTKYDKPINSRRNVVQGTYIHYNETKYYQTALPPFIFIFTY